VGCAVAGIALLSLDRQASATSSSWLGNLLLCGAVLCEAAYAVIGKKLSATLAPKRIAALINLWGFVLMTPPGLWLAWRFDFVSVSPGIWALLVFYALAASVWTVWLWMTGLKHVPAAKAGVFTVMLPISSVATGVAVLGEPFSGLQATAFAIALAGVLLATFPGKTAGPDEP
jgi:drug/metabolite transporter (DMT)-like permease